MRSMENMNTLPHCFFTKIVSFGHHKDHISLLTAEIVWPCKKVTGIFFKIFYSQVVFRKVCPIGITIHSHEMSFIGGIRKLETGFWEVLSLGI